MLSALRTQLLEARALAISLALTLPLALPLLPPPNPNPNPTPAPNPNQARARCIAELTRLGGEPGGESSAARRSLLGALALAALSWAEVADEL